MESLTDGGVDHSLATRTGAGTVVGAALLRAAVDGVIGLARLAVEVAGGNVPVVVGVGLGVVHDVEHGHQVQGGLLDHLSLGGGHLGGRRLERDGTSSGGSKLR